WKKRSRTGEGWCRRRDLNPHAFWAPPPQDGVSASSTTPAQRAKTQDNTTSAYLGAGLFDGLGCPAGGAGAGAGPFSLSPSGDGCAGAVARGGAGPPGAAGEGTGACSRTEPLRCDPRIARLSEVIMNSTAAIVVALVSTVAAPRLPRAVWLPPPPNAPARSAALPLCSRTTMISTKQTITCRMISRTS